MRNTWVFNTHVFNCEKRAGPNDVLSTLDIYIAPDVSSVVVVEDWKTVKWIIAENFDT